ncbi:HlyD family efflux transporter periplasmic adaptor subunit [Aureivirga marina]|uniref:HlyD family efflux transporter periplasmic adaptor subunit n=1 Tax=Aureivirga marina TaxID=1182451 RepID=UPI0018CA361B|nr:HlyD family efflux transporter periplasmic adaptor subunit [Aureivirga marina]
MENIENEIDLYSSEVKNILSTPPKAIYTIGYKILLVFIIVFYTITYFIKYPDTISVQTTISIPNQKIYASQNAIIDSVFVNEGQFVREKSILATLKNTANSIDVLFLKNYLNSISLDKKNYTKTAKNLLPLNVGELSISLEKFLKSFATFSQKSSKNQQQKLELELNSLKNKIQIWEGKYIIKSRENGIIYFTKNWKKNEDINENELIFSIVPNKDNLKCFSEISENYYHKLKIGQKVNITPLGYNLSNHGTIKGEIETISSIPNQNSKYFITFKLLNHLITTNGDTLKINNEIHGSAKIVTNETRVIHKIFSKFKF